MDKHTVYYGDSKKIPIPFVIELFSNSKYAIKLLDNDEYVMESTTHTFKLEEIIKHKVVSDSTFFISKSKAIERALEYMNDVEEDATRRAELKALKVLETYTLISKEDLKDVAKAAAEEHERRIKILEQQLRKEITKELKVKLEKPTIILREAETTEKGGKVPQFGDDAFAKNLAYSTKYILGYDPIDTDSINLPDNEFNNKPKRIKYHWFWKSLDWLFGGIFWYKFEQL